VLSSQAYDFEVISDSSSVTVQVTSTSLVYHPLFPSVPIMFGVTIGGVVSISGAGSGVLYPQ
jgi:hypothetical protein